ncbi:hypothetical protein HAX54_010821 [Datura stramonium]|uniref:Uncharacterized protein n=1 Tax=Datura stramonium TaxID=4076 RepID=A0ABS8TIQ0_DATST|nr:hypothetical protein [Datura stramonium]
MWAKHSFWRRQEKWENRRWKYGSAVNTGSGSGSWSNVGSVGLRSPMLNAADEVVSSTSSMCRIAEKSEEFSESESEASSDEDNDDPKDKNFRSKKTTKKGKEESNGRRLKYTQLAVEGEKHSKGRAYVFLSSSLSKSKKRKLNHKSMWRFFLVMTRSLTSSEEDCQGSSESAERTRGTHERKYFGESSSLLDVGGFKLYDSYAVRDAVIFGEGTVWDLVPLSAKATMYPHQREGFEFIWRNIAGDITLENLRVPLSGSRR